MLCATTLAFHQRYEFTLPSPSEEEIFRRYDALYRFLQRATAADPDDRFQSADITPEVDVSKLEEVLVISTPRQFDERATDAGSLLPKQPEKRER